LSARVLVPETKIGGLRKLPFIAGAGMAHGNGRDDSVRAAALRWREVESEGKKQEGQHAYLLYHRCLFPEQGTTPLKATVSKVLAETHRRVQGAKAIPARLTER
jgi:hypothetical protein